MHDVVRGGRECIRLWIGGVRSACRSLVVVYAGRAGGTDGGRGGQRCRSAAPAPQSPCPRPGTTRTPRARSAHVQAHKQGSPAVRFRFCVRDELYACSFSGFLRDAFARANARMSASVAIQLYPVTSALYRRPDDAPDVDVGRTDVWSSVEAPAR